MKKMVIIGVLVSLALIGCFSHWQGEEGTLTISLGGGTSRSAMPWPPQDHGILEQLNYIITLSGNGSAEIFEAKGGQDFKRTVSVGRWNVKVDAYFEGNHYATGSNSLDVKAGQNNIVTVTMTKSFEDDPDTFTVTFNSSGGTAVAPIIGLTNGSAISEPAPPVKNGVYECKFVGWYKDTALTVPWNFTNDTVSADITLFAKWTSYAIGETGPGGGIIFYVADGQNGRGFGFTLYTAAHDNIGTTAYYLEAAPADADTSLDLLSTSVGLIGTEDFIGTGMRNTLLILEKDPDSPAANYCKNYRGGGRADWFLPSIEELETMSDETRWLISSSEHEANYFYYLFGPPRDSVFYQPSNISIRVLPIRAF